MAILQSLHFSLKNPDYWLKILMLIGMLQSYPAKAEEHVLDLSFWFADQSKLALGGLWEFYSNLSLQPEERSAPPDFLAEISQPWNKFCCSEIMASGLPPTRASYARLIKGFQPRNEGYTIEIQPQHAALDIVAFPKYAPEKSRRLHAESTSFWRRWLILLPRPKLSLRFSPRSADEVWVIILHRSAAEKAPKWSVPELRLASRP